jgi:hypothetical protein
LVEPPLMSYRVTAGALVLLVLLGGLVWYTEFRDKGTAAAPAEKARPDIFDFEDQSVQGIEVLKGDQQITMERVEGGDWALQPSGQPGDRLRISGLLFRLSTLQANRLVADEATDFEQYGLAAPALTTTLEMTDGSTLGLAVGSKAPTDAGTYVKRTDGPAVYLVPNSLVTDLERIVNEPPVAQPAASPLPSPSPTPSPSP